MFLVPVLIDPEHKISFNRFNCYGASIWSGFLVSPEPQQLSGLSAGLLISAAIGRAPDS